MDADKELKAATGSWKTRDYFAEMYVAGVLADADRDIYLPRCDKDST